GVCAAGHKALYSEAWGGLPAHEFLCRLDPELGRLRDRLYTKAYAADRAAGALAREWAETFGLRTGIPIAMGVFDAHYGAVGAGVRVGTFVKIIGTSTCDIAIADARERVPDIPGICGIVPGSVLPGYYGIEAGQSAVGDLLRRDRRKKRSVHAGLRRRDRDADVDGGLTSDAGARRRHRRGGGGRPRGGRLRSIRGRAGADDVPGCAVVRAESGGAYRLRRAL